MKGTMDNLKQAFAILVGVGTVCIVMFSLIYGLAELSMLFLGLFDT